MPAHRNDARANAMYSLYQQGFSLAQVAKAFSVTRQGVFKMFLRRKFVLRTIEPLPFIIWNNYKYTLNVDGYYRRTQHHGTEECFLHREVWIREHGPIPEGYEIHHRDGDKTNNVVGNLEMLTEAEHGRKHGFGGNQYVPSTGKRPVR